MSQYDEVHPFDSCADCFPSEKRVHYVYVGEKRGTFDQNGLGQYYYVGPHSGPFEAEPLPPDHTHRCACVCCLMLLGVLAITYAFRKVTSSPLYDCFADRDLSTIGYWTDVKRVYCCEIEGIGCWGDETTQRPGSEAEVEPSWLDLWLPDLSLGSKFIMSCMMFIVGGVAVGCSTMYIMIRYCSERLENVETEEELVGKLHDSRERDGGECDGEIVITAMWDTKDELDLQLELPNGKIINHKHPEASGGTMDINRNDKLHHNPKKVKFPPVENIHWDAFCPYAHTNPPNGDYRLKVKMLRKREPNKEVHVTVQTVITGKVVVYHRRILPMCHEISICEFSYEAPRTLTEKEENLIKEHKKFRAQVKEEPHKYPLTVSMVWDTQDIVDLQVRPPDFRTRSAKTESDAGGHDSLHMPGDMHGKATLNFPNPFEGVYEVRAIMSDKKEGQHDCYATVVVNMDGKKKTFHHKVDQENHVLMGIFVYRKKIYLPVR